MKVVNSWSIGVDADQIHIRNLGSDTPRPAECKGGRTAVVSVNVLRNIVHVFPQIHCSLGVECVNLAAVRQIVLLQLIADAPHKYGRMALEIVDDAFKLFPLLGPGGLVQIVKAVDYTAHIQPDIGIHPGCSQLVKQWSGRT